jgi:peroxiredoxin
MEQGAGQQGAAAGVTTGIGRKCSDMHRAILAFVIVILGVGCAGSAPASNPAAGLSAVIVRPDGKPAAGARAVLVPAGHWVSVINRRSFDDDPAYQRSTADAEGRIHFAGMPSPGVLVVIDAAGYARVDPPELRHLREVRLQAWAHLHGRVMIGSQPTANARVTASPVRDDPYPVNAYSLVQTDAEGRFAMDRVQPGKVLIGRDFIWHFNLKAVGGTTTRRRLRMLRPGQSAEVSIGGTGRAVIGRVELPEQLKSNRGWGFGVTNVVAQLVPPPIPPEMRNDSLIARETWYEHFVTTDVGKKYLSDQSDQMLARRIYSAEMAADGTFRIQDVSAGAYRICIDVRGNASHDHPAGEVVARGLADFIVPKIPGNPSTEPLRIGPVLIKMMPTHVPLVGEMAPDFSVKTLMGKPLSLSQYRGKYVLLEFWATWCEFCVEATPRLQDVYAKYGKSGQIVMISLSEDELPYAPSEYVHKNHLGWAQGFIGEDSQVSKQYHNELIPEFWIIGPDGRIIAKPRFDADLSAAVGRALRAATTRE